VLGNITAAVRAVDPGTVNAWFIGIAAGLGSLFGLAVIAIIGAVGGWPIIIGAAVLGALAGAVAWVYQNWEHHKEAFVGIWRDLLAVLEPVTSAIGRIVAYLRSLIPGLAPSSTPPSGMPDIPGFTPLPGPGTPGGLMQRQSWVPPSDQPTLVPVTHEITLDGYKLGEAVAHYITASQTHVQSTAQYDGRMGHVPVDMGMA
jgi:hypothetical protein